MQEKSIKKTNPTFFPLGFGIGKIDGGQVLVVEFYDNERGGGERGGADQLSVIGSFALTAKKARELADALIEELEENQRDN